MAPKQDDIIRRLERCEARIQEIDDKINGLHNNSMAWVNQMLSEVKEMIHSEVEKLRTLDQQKQQRGGAAWLQVGITVLASVLSVVAAELVLHWR